MWIEVEAQRILFVDHGRDTILLDRYGSGGGTVVVKLTAEAVEKLKQDISQVTDIHR